MNVRGTGTSIWDDLRATRASPPSAVLTDEQRQRTYVFALEQAEQMFRAAGSVGPATRPLLIFYGLSQAGRAIVAAASQVHADWRLMGHGIRAVDLARPIADIAVYGEGRGTGSFVKLSEVLGSPTWGRDAPVGLTHLWDALPVNQHWPLIEGDDRRPALDLFLNEWDEPHPMLQTIVYLPPSLIQSANPRTDLEAFLAAYPQARIHSYVREETDENMRPVFTPHSNGWGAATFNFMVFPDHRSASVVERHEAYAQIATAHGDQDYLVPLVGRNTVPMHPLMTWWAVTFTLSMLARYEPAAWRGHIDVDSSPYAVAIEHLLSNALTELPMLIAHTLRDVSPVGA